MNLDLDSLLARYLPSVWRTINDFRLEVERRLLRGGAIGHGPRNTDKVALTFDDGPDPRWTGAILQHLKQFDAHATFFMVGSAIEQYPLLAKEVLERNQVATHLYEHRKFGIGKQEVGRELNRVLHVHERVMGARPRYLRFPFGKALGIRPKDLQPYGLIPVHWTFSSLDSRADQAAQVLERVTTRLRPGDIVLFHDGRAEGSTLGAGHRQATVDALPRILLWIKIQGWKAVTLDELLG